MAPAKIKRFYKTTAAVKTADGYHVALDGKPVRTPGGRTVLAPNRALAEALAAEWDAQKDELDLPGMGLHQLAVSAIDMGKQAHMALVEELAGYGATELLCYRADGPVALVARQTAAWDPLLNWAAARFGARLRVTTGVIAVEQDGSALAALKDRIAAADRFQLCALRAVVGIGGSLIVGLAMAEGHLETARAWQIVNVDVDWQREKWGEDAQAAANHAAAFTAFRHAAEMLKLLQVLENGPL